MNSRQAKFCQDRNKVRWVLLEGVINRKTQQDDPTKGKELPVAQITGIEQTAVERVHRSPVARPAIYGGLALLALFGWMATAYWWWALPGLFLGAATLFWGLKHNSGQKEVLDAYQIVAPGTNPEDWRVIGSHAEVAGFIEGVRLEMEEAQREKTAATQRL
jgi:hypothetical protein